ncbi:MAG TPA: filamentous hemagglutinin, partial [Cyanobacteria bacterium UBA11159]|nr:filamentous hemagglutinin [Cyanobacteria bacterium UBA11159]
DGQTHRGASGIAGSVQPGAVGNGGNLEINTGSLNVTNGAGIDASTFGQGNAGNVRIYTRNSITLDGDSGINSSVTDTGVGNGGEIEVSTGMLNIKNGSGIQVTTFGQGNGGNIAVTARDRITLDGDSGISSSVQKSGV